MPISLGAFYPAPQRTGVPEDDVQRDVASELYPGRVCWIWIRYQVVMVFKSRQYGLAREVRLRPQFQVVCPVGGDGRARAPSPSGRQAGQRIVGAETER